jgi:DNA-binding transcriptional MerR regulator
VVSRAHLSIGEVLVLLQAEFPDVTISKIRFLESQGLVDPERTPSGYRKFYDADIDRLRWVLRQQRDAFLPLKVIKGRLEDQTDPEDEEAEAEAERAGLEGELEGPGVTVEVTSVEVTSVEATFEVVEGDVGEPRNGALPETGEDQLTDQEPQLFDAGPPYGDPAEPGGPEDRPALHRRVPVGQRATTRSVGARQGNRHGQRRSDGNASARNASDAREPREPPEPRDAHGDREERSPGAHRAGGGRQRRAELAGEGRRGADEHELTLDELLEEAGVEIETVRELEGFGLIAPKVIGGSHYYTTDAAVVARLASAFARHGVEARHLRAYKGAADREAGLVEQVIMPLIRQRNPEARQAAAQAVEELSNLGGELRAALLRSALADLH